MIKADSKVSQIQVGMVTRNCLKKLYVTQQLTCAKDNCFLLKQLGGK